MNGLTAAEIEIELSDNVIKAAEDWSTQYKKDPENFAKLIKVESRLETVLRRYFKELSERVPTYINWYMYDMRLRQVAAADDLSVDVWISDDQIGYEDGLFISTAYDPIAQAVALGAQYGETIYSQPIGISKSSTLVQRTAKEIVAELVGKRVDKDGNIIDNPNAAYRISDRTRKDIRESLATSIALGEDQNAARARVMQVIKDPKRAEMIARTEAVNSYQKGLSALGTETGAVGKEWQSSNSDDICATNAKAGIILMNENFPSGHSEPAAHPNCRCGLVLIYPEDPRAKLIGKGPASLNPDWSFKGNKLNLTMTDGKVYPYDVTKAEKQFIKDTGLKIQPGTIRGRTQGYYTPAVHTLTIGNPDKDTFFHELGHAVDFKLIANDKRLSNSQAKDALEVDKKIIAMNRLRDAKKNMSEAELAKYVSGQRAKFKTASGAEVYTTISPSYQRYMFSHTELFAEAYKQYRFDPTGFAKQAPAIAKVIKELGL